MKPQKTGTSLPASFALGTAVLFGASTPVAKMLLGQVDPVPLAGFLYLGSGSGLALWWGLRRQRHSRAAQEANLKRADLPWLIGAIVKRKSLSRTDFTVLA
jgi:drug/metabolite transporter (DMT)-like permease